MSTTAGGSGEAVDPSALPDQERDFRHISGSVTFEEHDTAEIVEMLEYVHDASETLIAIQETGNQLMAAYRERQRATAREELLDEDRSAVRADALEAQQVYEDALAEQLDTLANQTPGSVDRQQALQNAVLAVSAANIAVMPERHDAYGDAWTQLDEQVRADLRTYSNADLANNAAPDPLGSLVNGYTVDGDEFTTYVGTDGYTILKGICQDQSLDTIIDGMTLQAEIVEEEWTAVEAEQIATTAPALYHDRYCETLAENGTYEKDTRYHQ